MVLWRPTRPSRTNTKKDALLIIGDWNAKVGSQEIPGVTGKFGLGVQNEAGQRLTRVLPRECIGHSKYSLHTTLEMTLYMDITRWSILKSDWWHFLQPNMENLYTVSKKKTWSWKRNAEKQNDCLRMPYKGTSQNTSCNMQAGWITSRNQGYREKYQ